MAVGQWSFLSVAGHCCSWCSRYGARFERWQALPLGCTVRGVDEIELASSSLVFQYSEEEGLFARVAAVKTGAARDIEVLALGGVTYFAVASFASQDGGQCKSLLYRLECSDGAHSESLDTSDGFAVRLHQSFDTTGGQLLYCALTYM